MKISYYSYGADCGGEYDVVSENAERASLLEELLPIPVFQSDGNVSLKEAASMALSHFFDDGSLGIVEAPAIELSAKVDGYIICFKTDGTYSINRDPDWLKEQDRIENLKKKLREIYQENAGHVTIDYCWPNYFEHPRNLLASDGKSWGIEDWDRAKPGRLVMTHIDALSPEKLENILKKLINE
jgi:hypothetical protein